MKKCMGTCFSQNLCFNIYRYTLHDFTEEYSLKSKNNCIATSIVLQCSWLQHLSLFISFDFQYLDISLCRSSIKSKEKRAN